MIIHLQKSALFTVDPSVRFAKEMDVNEHLWRDCWLKYKTLDLTNTDLRNYFYLRTGRHIKTKNVSRWITRTEIYSKAQEASRMGARTVTSEFFGDLEQAVLSELFKNMKHSGTKTSRSII